MTARPPFDLTIVPIREEHLAAIASLARVIWHAHYPGIISPEQIEYMLTRMYALETMRHEIAVEGVRYERMLCGDEFVGFGAYGPVRPPGIVKLHKLYVHPDWQRRGLGAHFLGHVAKAARENGAQRLRLSVNKHNTQAIAAYEKCGFTVREAVTVEIGGGFVMDDFVMEKTLGV